MSLKLGFFLPAACATLMAGPAFARDVAPVAAPLIAEADLPADPRFSAERVKADVAFLADDLLEGRDTGSRGHEIAARFVAQRFAGLGLRPMGDNGGWYQQITFQKTERVDAPSGVSIKGPSGEMIFGHGVDACPASAPMAQIRG